MKVHEWMFHQRAFREHLKLGEGGESGPDNDLVEATFRRIGANVMGKRMFEEGEANWPAEAPFHTPVFVLTRERREPWERPGGTTFCFVNDGIHSALDQARRAAGEKDVRIAGGADVVCQYLNAGLVDELTLSLSPILLGDGLRLFDGVDRRRVSFEILEAIGSSRVTHLRYAVRRAAAES
jgi:dihydrofolate reductase